MAEGHAVARWGDALRVLVGERIVDVQVPRRWSDRGTRLIGATVTGVLTRGKHLVLSFSVPLVIHAHAMQYGSWQVGARGLEPRKDVRFVRLRLVTPRHEALYFHGPVMEILTPDELAAHGPFQSLGPDLLHPDFAVDDAVARVRAEGLREVADAVLDQRVVSGIGNIYKSEGLFLAAIHPRSPSAAVPAAGLQSMFRALIPLMQDARFSSGRTVTLPPDLQRTPSTRNWVYRRRGRPCLRCGTPVEMIRQGDLRRATYFCPACQSCR